MAASGARNQSRLHPTKKKKKKRKGRKILDVINDSCHWWRHDGPWRPHLIQAGGRNTLKLCPCRAWMCFSFLINSSWCGFRQKVFLNLFLNRLLIISFGPFLFHSLLCFTLWRVSISFLSLIHEPYPQQCDKTNKPVLVKLCCIQYKDRLFNELKWTFWTQCHQLHIENQLKMFLQLFILRQYS